MDDYKPKTELENITNRDQPNLKPNPSNLNPEANRLPASDYFNKIETYYDRNEATLMRDIGTASRGDLTKKLDQIAIKEGYTKPNESSRVVDLVQDKINDANSQVSKVRSNLEKEVDLSKKKQLEERLQAEKFRCQKWIESYKALGFTNQSIISQYDKILERNCN